MSGRKKCEPGCGCGKHRPAAGRSACPEGCTCRRHNRPKKIRWDSAEEKRAYGREYARQLRDRDRGPSREAARRWREKNPGYRLRYKFGLSLEQWEQMFTDQQGLCYLCSEPLDVEAVRGIHVDHDHSCCRGEKSCGTCVRGLACFSCNLGIAKFGEDPERLRRVADNLEMANRRLLPMRSAAVTPREEIES